MKFNTQKGFTLIEVVIYVALFSFLLGGALVSAYNLIYGSSRTSFKNVVQQEGNFVLRKLNWALTGVSNINTPSAAVPDSDALQVERYDGDTINIRLVDGKIEIGKNSDPFSPLTTDNVKVSSLNFEFIQPVGSEASGIKVTAVISGSDFSITKYMRK
jgi:prepilin-type N-terminal cleavage/methylation domain-containing protein